MKKYLVTEQQFKLPTAWDKFLSKLYLKRIREPEGFEIYINADFNPGEVIHAAEKTYYVIKSL